MLNYNFKCQIRNYQGTKVEFTVAPKLNQDLFRHRGVIDGGRFFWLLFWRSKKVTTICLKLKKKN